MTWSLRSSSLMALSIDCYFPPVNTTVEVLLLQRTSIKPCTPSLRTARSKVSCANLFLDQQNRKLYCSLGQCKQYQKENNQEALNSNDGASGKRDSEGVLQTGTRARCPDPEQQLSLLQAAATSSQSYQRTLAPGSQ